MTRGRTMCGPTRGVPFVVGKSAREERGGEVRADTRRGASARSTLPDKDGEGVAGLSTGLEDQPREPAVGVRSDAPRSGPGLASDAAADHAAADAPGRSPLDHVAEREPQSFPRRATKRVGLRAPHEPE